MKNKIAIIGSGFSGLSAAAYLAKNKDNEVHVFEKNMDAGGRARQFLTPEGYVFDMGPSWYWMPDVIENFFNDFDFKHSDFYTLISLDPQFEIIFDDQKLSIPKNFNDLKELFEKIEQGAGENFEKFMQAAKYKYNISMRDFVSKPCNSWFEFLDPKIAKAAIKLDLFNNFRNYTSKYFKNKKLKTLMEFPIIFLGASPKKIPALYSLMNFGGYALGTHYPIGGFYQLVLAMKKIAENQGVKFYFDSTVEKINVTNKKASSLSINGEKHNFDFVVASSDYEHTESLLDENLRNYNKDYWKKKTFAPSCLIYYLGIKQKIPNLKHHTLFFENDLDNHIDCIYNDKKWPEKPLFYCCCPSKTDKKVAPSYGENIFLLMPIAMELEDQESIREKYLKEMISRLEKATGTNRIYDNIEYKKSYCITDFISDYNAYGGNAYGLANTLKQTAVLKPKIKNRHIKNLYYTGQLTVPGPGVPPSLISGKIVANQIHKITKYNV